MTFEYPHPTKSDFVQIVDDGQCAYAYYFRDSNLTGLVWLYNRVPREQANLARGSQIPLETGHIRPGMPDLPESQDDFLVNWMVRGGVDECGIYMRNKLLAVVGDGDRPGWNAFVAEDSDFAQMLVD